MPKPIPKSQPMPTIQPAVRNMPLPPKTPATRPAPAAPSPVPDYTHTPQRQPGGMK